MTDNFTIQKKIVMLILSMIPLSTLCQNVKVAKDSIVELLVMQTIFTLDSTLLIIDDTELFVDFPGGEKAMNKFINKNLTYPKAAITDKIEGLVYVNFTIDCSGEISNIKIVKGSNPYLDNEVIRLISIMPNWIWDKKIEMKNRKSVQRTLPINFKP